MLKISPIKIFLIASIILISSNVLAQSGVGSWSYWFIGVGEADPDVAPASGTATITCNVSGTSYLQFPDGETYPGKCSYSGNSFTFRSWGTRSQMNRGESPADTMNFSIDGNRISGQSVNTGHALRGQRYGTSGQTASQLAQTGRQTAYQSSASTQGSSNDQSLSSDCNGLPVEQYSDGSHLSNAEFSAQIEENLAKRKKLEEEYYARCGGSSGPSKVTRE